ncbi:MAG: PVC-type heme-binding CxxCH protein, partial [Pirellulaceae bacterium]
EVLAHNFRNNYEVTVDSFGTLWQSDNDDDGNKAVRINYVMEHGNYGYRDERTGAGWKSKRTGMHDEVPLRHWHLRDPGVVPNLLQTGAGSPTGITVYEGRLLPKVFWDQVIHCDAGPNVTRAYPVTRQGAGYAATITNVLHGARDNWFRPADVCVAPDGSLFVSDWYDPGVGGHRQGDIDRGRLFRVAPDGSKYASPKFDFTTPKGAVSALTNPALSVRYMAWTALEAMDAKAENDLGQLAQAKNPRHRARALWLLARIEGKASHYIQQAAADTDVDIRVASIRIARSLKQDTIPLLKQLVKDPSPQVRRECAIALRGHASDAAPALWATLAQQHDGQDRWYLEALGIGAAGQWDAYFGAWLQNAGSNWSTPTGRDIIWRSRAKATPRYLAKILLDKNTPAKSHARYLRAFDFLSGPEKDQALKTILGF